MANLLRMIPRKLLSDAEVHGKWLPTIQQFKAGPGQSLDLPWLNGFERRVVHGIAGQHGLTHESTGIGRDRHIVLTKGGDRKPEKAAHIRQLFDQDLDRVALETHAETHGLEVHIRASDDCGERRETTVVNFTAAVIETLRAELNIPEHAEVEVFVGGQQIFEGTFADHGMEAQARYPISFPFLADSMFAGSISVMVREEDYEDCQTLTLTEP